MSLRLSPRLMLLAQLAGSCEVLADVGTDHALLPVWMLLHGRCRTALACDVRPGPLARAADTVRQWGMTHVVRLILSDGLTEVPPVYDTLVIAGMGGELIARILRQTPPPPHARLILQPMSGEETLREYLYRSGHRIEQEKAVCEQDKSYIAFLVTRAVDSSVPFTREDCFLSPGFIPDAPGGRYIDRLIASHRKRRDGLLSAKCRRPSEVDAEERLLRFLKQKRQLCREE